MLPRKGNPIRLMRSLLPTSAGVILAIHVAASPCYSQVITDGSLGPAQALAGPDFAVTEDLGTIRGSNLFHSFSEFSLATGESATFSGSSTIENIISRVTGGGPSNIDGMIRSTIDGASLYLMNPSGVMFGPNASLDVKGSFHVSTADYLRLGDGGIFYAALGRDSVLAVAPVTSFGFLAENPSGISVQGSTLAVPDYQTFTLAGGDIDLVGGVVSAPGGRIDVASVASPSEVVPNRPGEAPSLDVSAPGSLGSVRLSGWGSINAGGNGGGSVLIRGGRLFMDNSYVLASTKGPSPGGGTGITSGNGIHIDVTGDVILDNGSELATNVFVAVAPEFGSGGVRVRADSVAVRNGALIDSGVFFGSTGGPSGDVEIEANTVTVENGGAVGNATASSATSGAIVIRADDVEVRDGGLIYTTSYGNPSGDAGNIRVDSDRVLVSGLNAGFTAITSQTWQTAGGNAGDITITGKVLEIVGGGDTGISSVTFGGGNAGLVGISTDRLSVAGAGIPGVPTGIFSNTFGSGAGGTVTLNAKSVELTEGGSVQTISSNSGPGGSISVDADDVLVKGLSEAGVTSGFYTFSTGTNVGGNVTMRSKSIRFLDNASIQSSTSGTGAGGTVDLIADDAIEFSGGSFINGATLGEGEGGRTSLTASEITLREGSKISVNSVGSGDGGSIEIQVSGSLQATEGGTIQALANGSGRAGSIEVTADSVLLSGVSDEPFVDASGATLLLPSGMFTQTTVGGGSGGDVRLTVRNLQVLDGARIDAQTAGAGDGGTIIINAQEDVVVSGANERQKELAADPANWRLVDAARSQILSMSNTLVLGDEATGNAGDIHIEARELAIRDQGMISSETWGPGRGGNISVVTSRTSLSGDARVVATSAVSPNAGKAGEITIAASDRFESKGSLVSTSAEDAPGGGVSITAGQVVLSDGSVVSAESSGKGNAGSIAIEAKDRFESIMSSVTTEAKQADGGKLEINAGEVVNLVGGQVSSSVSGGSGKGGTVEISAKWLTVSGTVVSAATNSIGPGGDVNISANDLEVRDQGSISVRTTNGGKGGTVEVSGDRVLLASGGSVTAEASGSGDGGAVRIDATESFLSDGGVVTSSAAQSRGGDIYVSAPSIRLVNGALVTAESGGPGNAGSIVLDAENAFESAESSVTAEAKQADGGNVEIRAGEVIDLSGGQVSSSVSGGGGAGGTVEISTKRLTVSGTVVSAATNSTGPGGDVNVSANDLAVRNQGTISVRTTNGGKGGTAVVSGDRVLLASGGAVTAEASGSGDGGAVRIDATRFFESDGGVVTSSAQVSRGGDVAITAPSIRLVNGAVVSAESAGAGDAGNIVLTARDRFESTGSSVTTNAAQADGGNIELQVGEMIHLVGSGITASVGGGPETTGGNIAIDPEFVVLKESRIAANAFEGRGGNIRIRAGTFIADPASSVDASSAKGIDGTVDIEALVGELSGSLVPLSGNFRSAADLLREPCVARVRGGQYSSFIVGGRDGLPIEPGGLLPSPMP